jgi:hypothetical protein
MAAILRWSAVPIYDLANDSASSATSLIFTLVRVIR